MPEDLAKFIAYCLGALIFVIYLAWKRWQAYQALNIVVESSLLLHAHIPGAGLTKISEGVLDTFPYKIMVAKATQNHSAQTLLEEASYGKGSSPASNMSDVLPSATILMLNLSHKTNVHFACFGISNSSKRSQINLAAKQNGLEPAILEGDFPDYFSLFCRPSEQMEVRQVLDPADMAFLVDFCKRENWEIFEDTIYFSQSSVVQPDDDPHLDNTTMVKDAQDFVERIQPVLSKINSYASK